MISDNAKIGTGLLALVRTSHTSHITVDLIFNSVRINYVSSFVLHNTILFLLLLLQGMTLLFLGMLFMFDSAMLALGDILFLMGLTLTIGTR